MSLFRWVADMRNQRAPHVRRASVRDSLSDEKSQSMGSCVMDFRRIGRGKSMKAVRIHPINFMPEPHFFLCRVRNSNSDSMDLVKNVYDKLFI
jgi:hypothetical protein